jgi:gliding motility-associated-like protein
VDVPVNMWGNQIPFHGNAYCGFSACEFGLGSQNYREYISAKLIDTLEAGKSYCLSFYINLGEASSFAVSSIGIAFTNDTLSGPPPFVINYIPNFVVNQLIKDTLNWVKLSGTIIANGGETFITIGNFNFDSNSGITAIKDTTNPFNSKASYYYIDSVSMFLCEEIKVLSAIPNIFTPNNDGVNDVCLFDLSSLNKPGLIIFNRWGNKVFESNSKEIKWDGRSTSGLTLATGVYYYIISSEEKTMKGFIQLIK